MSKSRGLFGPSREAIWRQLSDELHARFVPGEFWHGDKVDATHNQWTVTLDSYAVSTGQATIRYTRIRAPFVNPDGFRFVVYREGLFSEIGKWFGLQDVEVGYEPFDRDFIIKGTDGYKLRQLFADQKVRDLITRQPEIHFCVKDDDGWFGAKFPEGVDELYFNVVGLIKDLDRLKQLYELFAETLDQLCRIGSAYEGTPPVVL